MISLGNHKIRPDNYSVSQLVRLPSQDDTTLYIFQPCVNGNLDIEITKEDYLKMDIKLQREVEWLPEPAVL